MYVDKPKSIDECTSKTKFLKQILQNYNNLHFALLLNGSPRGCDFSLYKRRVNGMKERTLQMVEAYFSCTKADCTAAVMAAYKKFEDYRIFEFNTYTRCSFINFNRHCAQVLVQDRPPTCASAENIVISLLTCAKLKYSAHLGRKVFSFFDIYRLIV